MATCNMNKDRALSVHWSVRKNRMDILISIMNNDKVTNFIYYYFFLQIIDVMNGY